MNLPEYSKKAGTLMGETRNEVYSKYGEYAFSNTQFGWHHERPNQTTTKMYNLVDTGSGVKFLIVTITYELVDVTPIDPKTKQPLSLIPEMAPNVENPIRLDFEWRDANIPFISKEDADIQGVSYTL